MKIDICCKECGSHLKIVQSHGEAEGGELSLYVEKCDCEKGILVQKDIRATIRLLRYLTHGEGFASISVFDGGAGGGFSEGSLNVNLERSGLLLSKKAYEPEKLFGLIQSALWPFDKMTIEEIDKYYQKSEWDR